MTAGTVRFVIGATTLCDASVHTGVASCTSRNAPRRGTDRPRSLLRGVSDAPASLGSVRVGVAPDPVAFHVATTELADGRTRYRIAITPLAPGSGVPRGSVRFSVGGVPVGGVRLRDWRASCVGPRLVGLLVASYLGGKDCRSATKRYG